MISLKISKSIFGRRVDIVIANNKRPGKSVVSKYKKENACLVKIDLKNNGCRKILAEDLITEGDLARHDIEKLYDAVSNLISK
jgi:hypothetical protein